MKKRLIVPFFEGGVKSNGKVDVDKTSRNRCRRIFIIFALDVVLVFCIVKVLKILTGVD